MKAPQLISERLILEPLGLSFLSEDYLSWLNDAETGLYLDTPRGQTLQDLEHYLTNAENRSILFWAMTLRDSGRHIGNIKIDPLHTFHRYGEFGILLGAKDVWGKGYAKEASETVIRFCFESLLLRKITLGVVKDNVAAVKLYENLGFVTEGCYVRHGFYNGKWCDILRMALFNPSADQ